MPPRSCLAIDPGFYGAVALIDRVDINLPVMGVDIYDTPLYELDDGRSEFDIAKMDGILQRYSKTPPDLVIIEQVGPRPMEGVKSVFRFGYGVGIWHGLIVARLGRLPATVLPQDWKKALGLTADKEEARALAAKLYPDLADKFKRVKDHGRAEALLMAHYGLRYALQTSQTEETTSGMSVLQTVEAERNREVPKRRSKVFRRAAQRRRRTSNKGK